jgi:hypothetical protein
MKHHAAPEFWQLFDALPKKLQKLARKNFALLKRNPKHPSLHFKRIGAYWSVRVGRDYRAVAEETEDGLLRFWIGSYSAHDQLNRRQQERK